MASSTFQWNPDGSAIINVNGHNYHIQANALTPNQTIVVGGVKVGVPGKPVQPQTVQPYLDSNQQAQMIQLSGQWDDILSQANLANKQAGIQLNELDLPRIGLQSQQQQEGVAQGMAGRGLSMSGIRDSAVLDVERARIMAETAAKATFNAAQDRLDAATNQVNTQRTKWEDWAKTASGANARMDNAAIPPTTSGPVTLRPPGMSAPAGPAGPGPAAPGGGGGGGLPSIKPAAPGTAQPAQGGGFASGPPPGPNYVWNGVSWVGLGKAQPAQHGNLASGPPPGSNYYWNGQRWVQALPKVKPANG